MAETSNIEWTDSTFNPWEGCQKVGPGCDHCYAENRNARWNKGTAINWGPGAPRRRTSVSNWQKPEKWEREHEAFFTEHGRRRRVFCASLADVFDNEVAREWRDDLATLILNTPNLDWLLLTKRIGNVGRMLGEMFLDGAPDHVWIGATVVNQEEADRDIAKLLKVPARVRFLSVEPMLGAIDLSEWLPIECVNLSGNPWRRRTKFGEPDGGIDWVIVGGESGSKARPMQAEWAQSLRDQCEAAGVPFLFKQHGEWLPAMQDGNPEAAEQVINASDEPIKVGKKLAGRLLDGRTHDGFPEGAR